MSNYFITTEIEDNKFIGIVYNKNTNTKVYQTNRYPVQQDAINEANMYLRTNSFTKQPIPVSAPSPTRRCCGR